VKGNDKQLEMLSSASSDEKTPALRQHHSSSTKPDLTLYVYFLRRQQTFIELL